MNIQECLSITVSEETQDKVIHNVGALMKGIMHWLIQPYENEEEFYFAYINTVMWITDCPDPKRAVSLASLVIDGVKKVVDALISNDVETIVKMRGELLSELTNAEKKLAESEANNEGNNNVSESE